MVAVVKREKVLDARETAAETGTVAAAVIERIDGESLAAFDEIGVYLDVSAIIGGTQATGTLTLTGNAVADETVTIDDHVYTWKGTLAAADQVLVGATASDSLDNLIAAINGDAGEGTTYGTGTEAHATVTAAAGDGDTMDVTAITGGTAGNSIDSTETMTNGSWGAATLGSGADNGTLDIYLQRAVTDSPVLATDGDWEDIYAFPQVGASLIEHVIDLQRAIIDAAGGSLADAGRTRAVASLTADTLIAGHWGDRLRVVEKIGGTATSAGTYDLTLIGRRRE